VIKMTFDNQTVAYVIGIVDDLIRKDGEVRPLVIGTKGLDRYILTYQFDEDDESRKLFNKFRHIFRILKVDAIISVTDIIKDTIAVTYISRTEKVGVFIPVIRSGESLVLGTPKFWVGDDVQDEIWSDFFKTPEKRERKKDL